MIETELNKVLNYMKQYVENIYEHDSEPMLNYKDLQLVLDEIERLKEQLNDEIDDGLKQSEIMVKQHNEIERLNSIIKEVREYTNDLLKLKENDYFDLVDKSYIKKYLEILDKVEENK